ncbi:MAG: 2-hydroxyglutaryl-CoA dehydratase [Chloroflexi bacterium]|nr:2-hydroxyglutaryl-CoA dehydratase [Chloroflexota bacterium]
MPYFMGIDIGSGTSKGVIVNDGKMVASHLLPSGVNYREAAQKVRQELLAKAGLSPAEMAHTVVTGLGGNNLPFANQQAADLPCCARGVHFIFPDVRTVIDVGEQAARVLRVSPEGRVTNFVISERCAAGSGRFLRIIANVLRIDLKDVGPLSLQSKNPVTFTTGCAVFGESEAVSRVAEGAAKEDILAGVHKALANKIAMMVERVGLEPECAITGGGGRDVGLIKRIEENLGIRLLVPPDPQIITALGAAIMAEEQARLTAAPELKS